jgi:ABC-type glycerol-3-phosphate transport system substrate-binding protein
MIRPPTRRRGVSNQSLMTWSTMVVPKGAPNKEAAMQFLAYALGIEGQAAVAMNYTYGPVVPQAFDALPRERAAMLSGGPQQAGRFILANEKYWGENLEHRVARRCGRALWRPSIGPRVGADRMKAGAASEAGIRC